MPLPIKSRYAIAEAAKFIATATGELVTQSQILDWGSQGFYRFYAPVKFAAVRQVGSPDIDRIQDALVEVRLSSGQAATLGRGERVGFTTCWRDGIEFNFMRQKGEYNPGWRTDTVHLGAAELVLLGTELTAFAATLAAPAPPPAPNVETVPVEQAANPTAAKVEAVKCGITKQQVINAFEGLWFDDRKGWNNALSDVPNWIEPCRVTPGVQGSRKSATWNPVLIAAALVDKGITPKKLDAVFVRLKDWADEWHEVSALFRD